MQKPILIYLSLTILFGPSFKTDLKRNSGQNYNRLLLIITCLLFASNTGFARHIIGGGMSYTCLGNGDYEFELVVYRDCNGQGAPFDSLAPISIFQCNKELECANYVSPTRFSRLLIPLSSSSPVSIANSSCFDSFKPCIEQGKYIFKLSDYNIRLAKTEQDYYVIYQRCCRSSSINNIQNPGDNGNTFSATITPIAFEQCNNSAVFTDVITFLNCTNQPINTQSLATDPDGDSLAFQVIPLVGGGGTNTSIDFMECFGVSPNPPCPPPFPIVNYLTDFENNPLGLSSEPVTLNATSGIISGITSLTGQFAIGIEASEYRNGNLINVNYQEIQLGIYPCNPDIVGCDEINTITSTDYINDYFIKIYPNPAQDYINIKMDKPIDFQVSLMTVDGSVHYSERNINIINLLNLPLGLYLIKIEFDNSKQVILEKVLIAK